MGLVISFWGSGFWVLGFESFGSVFLSWEFLPICPGLIAPEKGVESLTNVLGSGLQIFVNS